MEELLSITKLAKLRGVTTETLRHYDRIELLKPVKIDSITNERFYSIYQYEQLGTIKELKQLGLSLKEIKQYFTERNIESTRELLQKSLKKIKQQQAELAQIQAKVEQKLLFLDGIPSKVDLTAQITQKELAHEQNYLLSPLPISNELELSYAALELEKVVTPTEPYLPIFATNRYIGFYASPDVTPKLGIRLDTLPKTNYLKVKAGTYLTLKYQGTFWQAPQYLKKLREYGKNNNLILAPQMIQTQLTDITFTANSELLYELQIAVLEL